MNGGNVNIILIHFGKEKNKNFIRINITHQSTNEVKQGFLEKLSQLTKDEYPAIPSPLSAR